MCLWALLAHPPGTGRTRSSVPVLLEPPARPLCFAQKDLGRKVMLIRIASPLDAQLEPPIPLPTSGYLSVGDG